jgi:hypothetical protein
VADNNEQDDIAQDAPPLPPDEPARPPGPPEDWTGETWFDFRKGEWWHKHERAGWRLDPPPIQIMGHAGGEYEFVTEAGEVRKWTSSQLHGRGGMADLFGGDVRWATRHFPGKDKDDQPTGRPNVTALMERLIWVCRKKGYLDGTRQHLGVGTWRGPDETPIVHAGDAVFYDGEIYPPGSLIGAALYTIGGARARPAHVIISERWGELARFDYKPKAASRADGLWVINALNTWHWQSPEALELFAGGLFVNTLGDAPAWKNHMFVQAPPESGKSHLLRFAAGLLGGSAGPLAKTFSKSFLEIKFSGKALAIILDEAESEQEADRIKHLFELLRMLNDDGAKGGRGSTSGKTRDFDVHGPVIMAATLRERWRPQDRRRVMLLHLRPFTERGEAQASKADVARLIKDAGERSAAYRARAIELWPLFLKNLAVAHKAVMDLGGTSGDGDQLGGLIAGWWTSIYDDEADADRIADVKRFADFIRTVVEAEAGDDEPTNCFRYLLGAPLTQKWGGGRLLTVGQTIARAREKDHIDGGNAREALHPKGLRLIPEPGGDWSKAWLAIANKHNGLEEIFGKKPEWADEKWNQAMVGLLGSQSKHPFDKANPPIRFAGPPSRALFVPPVYLPNLDDERDRLTA